MTRFISSIEIGKEICDILGLDVKFTRNIVVKINADEIVTIEVTHLLQEQQAHKLVTFLKTSKFLMVEETELDVTTKDGEL